MNGKSEIDELAGSPFPGVAEFVFEEPLYGNFVLSDNDSSVDLFQGSRRIEGHCIQCQQRRVFIRDTQRSVTFSNIDQSYEIPNGFYRL